MIHAGQNSVWFSGTPDYTIHAIHGSSALSLFLSSHFMHMVSGLQSEKQLWLLDLTAKRIRLVKFTFGQDPHQLARLVLKEQTYRYTCSKCLSFFNTPHFTMSIHNTACTVRVIVLACGFNIYQVLEIQMKMDTASAKFNQC